MFENVSRRSLLRGAAAGAALGLVPARFAIGGQAKVKVGLLLSHGGTFAIPVSPLPTASRWRSPK